MVSAADQSLVERDPSLTGLRLLLDEDRLTTALCNALGEAPGQGVNVDYLRYKPGVNCIARFRFGERQGYLKAFAGGGKGKIAKALQANDDTPTRDPVIRLADASVVCRFFPQDARLPALARLATDDARKDMFERVFKTEPAWREARFEVLNYKPERRFVARLQLDDHRQATLKLFNDKAFAATRRSRKKLNLPEGLRLPRWIGGSKNLRALAFEWLPGVTLDTQFRRSGGRGAAAAGSAIARLHASEQPALGKRKVKSRAVVIDSLAQQLTTLAPKLTPLVETLSDELRTWSSALEPVRRPIHGDFYAQQVIVDNGNIGVIDMDSAHLGDPRDDLGSFLAHMERASMLDTVNRAILEKRRIEFLEGYTQQGHGQPPEKLDPFVAYHLFKLSPRPFRGREPAWHERTERLLERCRALLARR